MRKLFFIFIAVIFPILIGALKSCSKEPHFEYKEYLIQVDSIKVPPIINVGIPFQIEFYGTISYSGCSEFSHFTVTRSDFEIGIEAWKLSTVPNPGFIIACPAVMVYLDGEILEYQLDDPGVYEIKIKRPDRTFLRKRITVT